MTLHKRLRQAFLVSVLSAATLMCDQAKAADTPSLKQLHQMLLEQKRELQALKANQSALKTRAKRAESKTRRMKSDLERTRAALESARAAPVPAVAVAPPPPPPPGAIVDDRGWVADVRGIYLFDAETGADPAIGTLKGPIVQRNAGQQNTGSYQGTSHALHSGTPDMDGGGVRVSLLKQPGNGWFAGGVYELREVDGRMQRGQRSSDTDLIHANLVNRTMADNNALNDDFDSGQVDFARDEFDIGTHTGDLVLGRKTPVTSRFTASWKAGTRIAYADVDRKVFYENIECFDQTPPTCQGFFGTSTDFNQITFDSEMWGAGGLLGAGGTYDFGRGLSVSTDASIAAVYSKFELKRNDMNLDSNLARTGFVNHELDTYGLVPMFDASIDVKKDWGRFYLGVGYTVSAWLGGSRTVSIPGWDDVDDETQSFTIERDDFITQGVYARAGIKFGAREQFVDVPMK